MKQSFIKKLSLLTVLLVMTFGAFAQVGNSLALLTSTNTSPIEHQTTQTRADVLYNNDVPTTTSGLISVYWAGSDVLVQIADDFEGLAGWSIEEVVTNGFSNTSTIPTTYGIHFYADDNGKPGEELYSNINCQGVEGDVITITLPEAFVIETDGKYWISIYGVRSTAQDFTTRFDIYTSTTGVGSKLHLIDHANIFGAGTNWQSVDPSLVSGELSMTFTLYGEIVEIGQPPVEAGEAVATIQGANVHLAWEPETTTGLTGFEIYRRDCYATDWEGAELIAGNIPAAQTEYMDYSWAAADYGVYNWGVFAYYESEPTAIYSSNCLDKDMLVEVDVTVTLNDGEAATGTVVTFTNTSEPDLELVYEVTLTATGKYTWDEFRKGTYDISVVKEGFASATETDYQITEDESFTWLLEENLNQPIDLYVTPTAYASWKGTVPAPTEPVVVTIGEGTTSVSDAPFYTLYNYSYAQQIFDADEIGSSGTINSVAFQYNTTLATLSRNVKIYLGNTTQNTFATTSDWVVATDLELVYEGTIDIDNSNEWLVIEFDTPFAYTGDNLVLATADVTGTWTSSRSSLGHTASEKTLVSFRDGSVITPEAPMTSGAVYKRPYRNNVQFGMDVPVIDRAAVQYKVFLNQTFIANTNTPYYQYDVATLTVGEDYLSEVLVEYSTGQSSKAYYTFTYAGCEAYNPPTALASTQPIGTKDAVLTWTNPSLTDVDFLRVYRNGKVYKNKLSMDTPFTTWTDPELENGTYNYALTLVYDDGAETCLTAATTAVTIKSTGIAKGKVTYALGGNVNGATITISNTSNTYTLTTNASGDYTGTVEAGDYEIKCEFAGHISQTTNITVAYVGETTTNFSLLEIPVALQEVLAWEEGNAVQVSWTGGPPPPPGEYARIELVANDTWGDGTGYIALLDEDAEFAPDFTGALFYTEIPMSIFSKAEYTVPEDATNLLATTPKVVTGSAYVDIPAGTYDYALLSPDQASGRIWTVGSGGPAQPIGDNFVFEPNKKYTFTFAMYGTGDGAALTVEDFSFKGVAMNIVYPKPVVTNNTPVEKVSSLDASSKTEKFDKLSPEELSVLYSANNYVQVDKGTRALTGYDVYRTDCYDGELELLASLPATAGSFIDNQWSGLDFGVYKWGVVSVYELNESEVTYSNCLDKDMITEVSVKVNLNTAESPVDTKVTLVNISEPDM
ncbi:DUF2436 domain-containing protein, partial [Bacteroidales bacterium OttesenSCG-928-K03]|nr:DUF2436 domain-containing protein [Bacteroidales bacterium OttesenSCG-928-K03]